MPMRWDNRYKVILVRKKILAIAAALCLIYSMAFSVQAAEGATFSDVDASAGYAEAIHWAAENGYVNGYADGRFGVGDLVSRAQLAAIFYRAAGSPAVSNTTNFSDVKSTAYYTNAVKWAAGAGLINGYSNGQFGVEDSVSRQQVVTILWRWAGSPAASSANYKDADLISSYARTAAGWSYTHDIMAPRKDGSFSPGDSATRAEIVSALYQCMNLSSFDPLETDETKEETPKLRIQAGGQTFTATLEDNPTTRALLERFPMTITMKELNGNEKYYDLPFSLPTDAHKPGSIHAGDIMLFGSDCLVLFYDSFSSGYSYTRLGSIDNPSGLSAALGSGNVDVTFQT